MDRVCRISHQVFSVSDEDEDYLVRLSPRIGGSLYRLPPPTLSPDERKRRRLAFRNERNLYHRSCALTGKPIISIYSPDKELTVYSKQEWWSDNWDYRDYGREFDFSRPFFEQFAELFQSVPKVALITSPDADENNCPYINFAGNSKNCHLIFDSDFDEDSCYSNVLKHSRDCIDCSYVHSSELCYECVDCTACYQLAYSQNCSGCTGSFFLYACTGCNDCCFSTNLVQKQYYFRNQPYSREDYFEIIRSLGLHRRSSVSELRREFVETVAQAPRKSCRVLRCEDAEGDYLVDSRNIRCSFNIASAEDLRYCDSVFAAKTCMDVSSFGEQIDHVYESGTVGINVTNTLFAFCAVLNCSDLIYCTEARLSKNCFGCASIKNAEYCILNKQYSAADYIDLVPRIIDHMRSTGEWGEYFPIGLSPFGYNETLAQEVFPLARRDATALGANWSNYQTPPSDVPCLSPAEIPDDGSITDDILGSAIRCAASGKAFRLSKAELGFYRKLALPLPVEHPDARHRRRMSLRNPQRLWRRRCAKSGEEIWTSFPPESGAIVYGERAYLDLVHS